MVTALLSSYVIALIAAPAAIRVAVRTGFLDRPVGYKGHSRPTPYLGGAIILVGFLAGAMANVTAQESHLAPLLVGASFLWAVGTVDDRVALGPRVRVVAEVLAALLLWRTGLGWTLFDNSVADLLVTVLWVVGLVNAVNLMDNLDGAAATVAGVSAAGIAVLAIDQGPESLAALALAVTGSCVAFLHFNLTRPARIFLGDGGSMLLGFLIAALSMAVWRETPGMDGVDFLPAIMLVGLPVLDMTLVVVSRIRRGAPVGKGGRDHITHRLFSKLGSTWAVALTLALAQGALCLAAIEIMQWPAEQVLAASGVAFLLGVVTITLFETPLFEPEHPGYGTRRFARAGGSNLAALGLALAALVGSFFLGRALTGDERREPTALAPDPGVFKLPAVGDLALARGVPELAEARREGPSGGQGRAEPSAPLTPEPELAAETAEVPADEEPIAAIPQTPPEPEPPAPAPPAPSPPPPPAPEPKPDKPDKPPKPDDTTTFDDTG